MRGLKIILFFGAVFLLSTNLFAQKKIIFDTDFGGDADDLGALAMLHSFIDKEECDLLAIMCWSTEMYAISAMDAVNSFYKHPNIPMGTRKDSIQFVPWNYSKPIVDKFPHKKTHQNVLDATVLYRQILTKSADKDITIVTVGPLKNIQNLINSKPDSISEFTGKQLIEQKVKEFVIMGGKYPAGKWEWNFSGAMEGVTKFVIPEITVPITFSGFEVGLPIKTGKVFNKIDKNTPLYVGFLHFSNNAPWMKEYYNGKIIDNASFDQTAVLYAVRGGINEYWTKVSGSTCLPNEKGGNKWIKDMNSNHSYLKLKMDEEKLASIIESIMLSDF